LYKGILYNTEIEFRFYYDVPIPSMKDYLFEAVGLKVKSPEEDEENGAVHKGATAVPCF